MNKDMEFDFTWNEFLNMADKRLEQQKRYREKRDKLKQQQKDKAYGTTTNSSDTTKEE